MKNHGFRDIGQNRWENGSLEVNLEVGRVRNGESGRKVCIQMNQGMLCDETLKLLLEYKPPREIMEKIAKNLAKTLVEAGLSANPETAVLLFKQIQTMINNGNQCQT